MAGPTFDARAHANAKAAAARVAGRKRGRSTFAWDVRMDAVARAVKRRVATGRPETDAFRAFGEVATRVGRLRPRG